MAFTHDPRKWIGSCASITPLYRSPKAPLIASRVSSITSSVCAVERNIASNWEGAIHFSLVESVIRSGGYKFDILEHASRENVETGLKYVNTGAVKGVTVDQVEQLKKMALRSVTDRHKVQELTEENTRLRSQVPSMTCR